MESTGSPRCMCHSVSAMKGILFSSKFRFPPPLKFMVIKTNTDLKIHCPSSTEPMPQTYFGMLITYARGLAQTPLIYAVLIKNVIRCVNRRILMRVYNPASNDGYTVRPR